MNTQQKYKYNILAKLDELTVKKSKIAKSVLPKALKVTKRTFELYLYIKLEDNNNISAEKLQILASFFGCSIEDLINTPVPTINYEELHNEIINDSKQKFGL